MTCLTTREAKREAATDEEQLDFATQDNRALLTFNIRHFAPLHERCVLKAQPHAGIIVSKQLGSRQYGLLLGRVLRLLDEMTADEMRNNFVHLEQFK